MDCNAAPTKRRRSQYEAEEEEIPCLTRTTSSNNIDSTSVQEGFAFWPYMLDPGCRGPNQGTADPLRHVTATLGPYNLTNATTAPGPSNHHTETTATQPVDFNQSLPHRLKLGPKLYPAKQKLMDLIRAEMIIAGDEMKYEGGRNVDYVNCTIIVREISSRSALNLTITFLPTPDPALPLSALPPPVQINPVRVESPTELEDILLSHYGVDTKHLSAKFRRTWPSFTIIRDGESQGTLADLRANLGQKRIAGDRETLEKMAITRRRPKQTKAPEGQSTFRVQEGAYHDAEHDVQMDLPIRGRDAAKTPKTYKARGRVQNGRLEQTQVRVEQMEQELEARREALDHAVWLARELYRLLRELAENELLYPLLKQRLVNKIAEIEARYPRELWAVVTAEDLT